MKTTTLKSGTQIPVVGLGTDNITTEKLTGIVSHACNLGYQLFDTATAYQNHHQLAEALKVQKNTRALVCTKFNNGDLLTHKSTGKVVETILNELAIQQIDCLLIHNPKVENFTHVFNELIAIKKDNIVKSLGVSNFTIKHLEQLKNVLDQVDLNQVELHPMLTQSKLVDYCRERDIKIIAYRPFGFGSKVIFENAALKNIASKYNKSVSQIVLRWLVQQGHIVIPKATSTNHLKENIDIFDFELSESDLHSINQLNQNLRTCTGPWAEFDE